MVAITITDANYLDIVRTLIADNRKVRRGLNAQQLPSKGAGNRVRNCFVPRPGFTFLGADLSQIEPRIMAHIMYTQYGDNSMRQIFVEGVDLYTTMAMMTFDLPQEYCVDKAYDPTHTFQPRKMMKTGQLAKSYGQTPKAFAKKMGVTEDVAHEFFERFDKSFPSFTAMVTDTIEFMRKNGYVETLYGRKRRFPDYKRVAADSAKTEQRLIRLYTDRKHLRNKSVLTPADERKLTVIQDDIDILSEKRGLVGYWERAAFNGRIQGTGADVLKMIGNRNARECRARGWEFNASIHDEIKDSIPNDQLTRETVKLVSEIMTQTATLSVPLVTDLVIEPRWMIEFGIDEWDFANCRPLPEFANKYGEAA